MIAGILLVGIIAVTLTGCKHTDSSKKETEKPVITLGTNGKREAPRHPEKRRRRRRKSPAWAAGFFGDKGLLGERFGSYG